jgi:DNA-binding NarL/FixJ family response regulator
MGASVAVQVYSQDLRLQNALTAQLRKLPGVKVVDATEAPLLEIMEPVANGRGPLPTVLVASTHDIPVAVCQRISDRGILVIMLAPVIREKERAAYLAAGAHAYLEMDVSNRTLVESIRAVAMVSLDGDGCVQA